MQFFRWGRAAAQPQAAVADPQKDAGAEARSTVTHYAQSSDAHLVQFLGGGAPITTEVVTVESALGVPAISAAVTFLSRTLAALPLKFFLRTETAREPRRSDPAHGLMNWAANDETSGFDFRRMFWQDVFTIGRGLAFIERNGRGQPLNLWPLATSAVTVERRAGRTLYHYRDGGRTVIYQASEVLDLCYMPGADRLSARSPIYSHAGTVGLAQAVTRYGARIFDHGGVPPFVLEGPIQSAAGAARASADMTEAVKRMSADRDNALVVPDGHSLKPLGLDPEKMQMIETQRFLIEQIARIYGLPPVFLQDLVHGTYSNTEQQDLHLSKHVIAPWCRAFEGEINLKFYGRRGGDIDGEHALDGLLRGDLRTRAEATSQRINTGQLTINEAREIENRPPVLGGDKPLVQGAMIPADLAGQNFTSAPAADTQEGQSIEN